VLAGRPAANPAKAWEEIETYWRSGVPGFFVNPPLGSGLDPVHIVNPPDKKGTTAYKAWAKRAFYEIVRHGWSYSRAAEGLGYSLKASWEKWSLEDLEWAQRVRAVRESGAEWQYPDMSAVSFETFVWRYFGIRLSEHQRKIVVALEDPMGRIVQVLGHPESGKSTLVTLWYVLYRIAKNPNIRIAIVSKNGEQADALLERVKRYLTERQLYEGKEGNLIDDFNGWKPEAGDGLWQASRIFVRHRTSGERDPTAQSLGIGKLIYGTRLDLLILDDALVTDNQLSPTMRAKLDNWFTGEVRSRASRGQTVINGTRLLPFDLYGVWKKRWKGLKTYRLVVIPALLDEFTEEERPSWPEYWLLEGALVEDPIEGEVYRPGLRDIRTEFSGNPLRWKLVWQQEDIEETEAIFRQDHIDRAFDLGAGFSLGQVLDHEILILGVDPATTGRAFALLIAFDPSSRVRRVVDIFVRSNLGATGIRHNLFYQFWERYRDHRVQFSAVETNFAPTLMGDESFLERARAAGTIVVDHKTLGRGHKPGSKWDEEYGVAALASLFGNGLIAFPSRTDEDKEKLRPLIEDLLAFPFSEEQDGAIALWVANGVAGQARHEVMDQVASAYRRGVPPIIRQRTGMRNTLAAATTNRYGRR
jgi:hypothetical protein